jgi:two-component system, sensor histidine kinase and response regulator
MAVQAGTVRRGCPLVAVGIDRAVVIERLGGDESLLAEIAQIFVEDCPRLIGSVEAAVKARDAKALARATHTIAGSVGNFTEDGVYALARTVEHLAIAEDFDGALAGVPELLKEIERVRAAFAELKP